MARPAPLGSSFMSTAAAEHLAQVVALLLLVARLELVLRGQRRLGVIDDGSRAQVDPSLRVDVAADGAVEPALTARAASRCFCAK